MDTIGERLKNLRGTQSQTEFAQKFGISRNTLVNYEKGASVPDSKLAALICEELTLSAEWFLFGNGPKYRKEVEAGIGATLNKGPESQAHEQARICQQGRVEEGENGDLKVPVLDDPEPDKYNWVPMVEAELSAGGGSLLASERIRDYYAFRKPFIRNIATSAKNLVLMRVSGDSMDPEIRNGATVMIDLGRKRIKNNCIFALGIQDTIIIKELELLPGGSVRIISKNRNEYPAYEADANDLRIIGQVVWGDRLYPL